MKHLLIIPLVLTLGLFSACVCTKKACLEQHNVSISFYGYDETDMDTVYTTGYAAGSGFTQIATAKEVNDLSDKRNSDSSFYFSSFSHNSLSDDQDWELYIPATNKTYRITGYTYSSYSCNNCPFDKDDKVKSLSGCAINGIAQSASPAKIYK